MVEFIVGNVVGNYLEGSRQYNLNIIGGVIMPFAAVFGGFILGVAVTVAYFKNKTK